jgi:hypothetical protein
MMQIVAKRHPQRGLESVECFGEDEHLDAAVAAELAEIEGLEAQVFLGSDLVDVAQSSPSWFEREAA